MSARRLLQFMQQFFVDTWYNRRWWARLLLPLSWLFYCLASLRSCWHKKQALELPVPVVVIGNISVGGSGKTPVIIALAKALRQRGLSIGVVSRGYGSHAPYYPYLVASQDTAAVVGDEPLLIANATVCPVAIGADRVAAAQLLLQQFPQLDIILSDDGLQHYRLARAMEVVVVDAARGVANHYCLPAGPLREPVSRLSTVDWVLQHGDEPLLLAKDLPVLSVKLAPLCWQHVATTATLPLQPLPWSGLSITTIRAIAGIGHPQRFFDSIKALGIDSECIAFADHYMFAAEDFSVWQDDIVLMTAKDAVKCREFAHPHCWSLVVEMSLPSVFVDSVANLVEYE